MGDLNVRIGEQSQYLNEIYEETFKAGLGRRKSKDKIVNNNGRKLLEFCTDNNLLILNGLTKGDEDGEFTYIGPTGQSVNDICAISQEILNQVKEFEVEDKTWSDHLPIKLLIKISTENIHETSLKLLPKLYWRDLDKEIYQTKLNENIHKILDININPNLDDLAEIIYNSAKKQNNGKKDINFKQKLYNIECYNARNKMFDLLKKHKLVNTPMSRETYLNAMKTYKAVCQSSKRNYTERLLEKINNVWDSQQWWKVAKEIRNQTFQIGSNITARDFKDYFQQLLNPANNITDISYAPNFLIDPILDCEITMSELKSVLKKFKMNKAPGEDRIPYEHIVNATNSFHEHLLKRYNTILSTGNMDNKFNRSVIFPIHKKGDTSQPQNYRGIAFMNCLAKTMVGILNERLSLWAEYHNILVEYQAGFRRGYSAVGLNCQT
ncbi:uncharacterized protein LOC142230757 [Haematobia irritans]|uniref:uncharacterized protein LOC142230757 n=1 Tax=Haematobia irritans TaxID=7368 RepID=UPI003F50C823